MHAHNHFTALKDATGGHTAAAGGEFGLQSVAENLVWAIEGELGEVNQMYPAYLKVAEMQEELEAARSFHYALEAENIHAEMFGRAWECALKGKDMPISEGQVCVCPICDFTHVGKHKGNCPVCICKPELFVLF